VCRPHDPWEARLDYTQSHDPNLEDRDCPFWTAGMNQHTFNFGYEDFSMGDYLDTEYRKLADEMMRKRFNPAVQSPSSKIFEVTRKKLLEANDPSQYSEDLRRQVLESSAPEDETVVVTDIYGNTRVYRNKQSILEDQVQTTITYINDKYGENVDMGEAYYPKDWY
jgi:hypothetical protein